MAVSGTACGWCGRDELAAEGALCKNCEWVFGTDDPRGGELIGGVALNVILNQLAQEHRTTFDRATCAWCGRPGEPIHLHAVLVDGTTIVDPPLCKVCRAAADIDARRAGTTRADALAAVGAVISPALVPRVPSTPSPPGPP